jgi:predicted secreted protein
MTIFTGVILYIMLYWLFIFMVLPWGNRAAENVETGNSAGAPAYPRIKQKFIITGIVAAIAWLIVFTLIKMDVIDFYEIARQMREEDLQR